MSSSTIDIATHAGQSLKAASDTYPTLLLTLVEMTQNAVDANATRIIICIDRQNRKVYVFDNGEGIEPVKFNGALTQINKSIKDTSKLGQFGRGLISPLCKCEAFTVLSLPEANRRDGHEWIFVRSHIIASADGRGAVHMRQVASLGEVPNIVKKAAKGDFGGQYFTMIRMDEVVADKAINEVDLDKLEYEIKTKLGRVMLGKGTKVRVAQLHENGEKETRDIEPTNYIGEPLPKMSYQFDYAGTITFELFRARRTRGKDLGVVGVIPADGLQPITIKGVRVQALGRKAYTELKDLGIQEVLAALESGYFEGLVTVENINLDPSREKFAISASLDDLYLALCQWWEDFGGAEYANAKDVSREERYRTLSMRSAERLRDLFKDPKFMNLAQLLQSMAIAGEHTGNTPVTRPTPNKDRLVKPRGPRIPNPNSKPRERKPAGSGGGSGLDDWFEHDTLPGSPYVWELDHERFKLVINIRHPLWVALDETNGKHLPKNARMVMDFQEYLALEVLFLLSHFPNDPERFEEHRAWIDSKLEPYCALFITSSRK